MARCMLTRLIVTLPTVSLENPWLYIFVSCLVSVGILVYSLLYFVFTSRSDGQ